MNELQYQIPRLGPKLGSIMPRNQTQELYTFILFGTQMNEIQKETIFVFGSGLSVLQGIVIYDVKNQRVDYPLLGQIFKVCGHVDIFLFLNTIKIVSLMNLLFFTVKL